MRAHRHPQRQSRVGDLLGLTLALGLCACGGSKDAFESVAKLRAFGTTQCAAPVGTAADQCTAVVGQPSTADTQQEFTLTFHAAMPLTTKITSVEPFVDPSSHYAAASLVTMVANSEAYEAHSALQLYSVQAKLAIPTAEVLKIQADPGFARMRYAVRLKADGEEQQIVGTVLVYPAGAPQLSWTAPTIDITKPTASSAVGDKQDIDAAPATTNAENLRIGWYVSSGTVKNRRAKTTQWEKPSTGAQTIFVTARGLKSGAFAFKVIDVTAQ